MKKSKTLSAYRGWTALDYSLKASKYVAPLVPATVMTLVNWDEWFVKSGASLPFGFATLLIAVLLSVVAIAKKDKVVNEKISYIYFIGAILGVWAISFMFLANIFSQIGQMVLWTALGVTAGATADEVDMLLAKPRRAEYKELIETHHLSASAKKRQERKERARLEAENESKNAQAID